MQRYEYKRVFSEHGKIISLEVLNELGSQGWKLADRTFLSHANKYAEYMIFIRPIESISSNPVLEI